MFGRAPASGLRFWPPRATVAALYERRRSSNLEIAGGPRSASAAARSLKNAKRKRGSAQPQEREAQARQRAASRTRSASAAARRLKNAKRKRGSAPPQELDRPYSAFA